MTWRRPRLRIRTLLRLIALIAVVLWGGIVLVSPTRWLERRLRPGAPAFARRDAAGMLGESWLVPPWEVNRAVSALLGALDDPNAMVRQQAVIGLGGREAASVRAIPELVGRLADESGSVRYAAAVILGELAPMAADRSTASRVEAALIEAMDDPDPLVRLRASQSLLAIGREDAAVAGIAEALTGPDEQVRVWAALDVRGGPGWTLPGLGSALARRLEGGAPGVSPEAIPTLVDFAPLHVSQFVIRRAATSPDPEIREAAAAYLAPIATEADSESRESP